MAKKILFVDDEPDVLTTVTFRLTRSGYNVITAIDGEKAVSAIRTERPDLVLLDMRLPGMNGMEVCGVVRSDPDLKNTPIILFTASASSIAEDCAKCGANDYVLKPFDPKELLEKINKYLR